MSGFGDGYILSPGRDGHERLRVLCEIHDPLTRSVLLAAGLHRGAAFAEFACGLGYVSRWVATRGVSVTSIDLSEEHLKEATRLAREEGLEHIEFKCGSIYDSVLPAESFDFAYCRFILSHLNRPVAAMRSMAACLKPGGILICEEPDLATIYSEPASKPYEEAVRHILRLADSRDLDYRIGPKIALHARSIGFELQQADAYQRHFLDGKAKGFWTWSFTEAKEALLTASSSAAELEECLSEMRAVDADDRILVGHARVHQVVARKPA